MYLRVHGLVIRSNNHKLLNKNHKLFYTMLRRAKNDLINILCLLWNNLLNSFKLSEYLNLQFPEIYFTNIHYLLLKLLFTHCSDYLHKIIVKYYIQRLINRIVRPVYSRIILDYFKGTYILYKYISCILLSLQCWI